MSCACRVHPTAVMCCRKERMHSLTHARSALTYMCIYILTYICDTHLHTYMHTRHIQHLPSITMWLLGFFFFCSLLSPKLLHLLPPSSACPRHRQPVSWVLCRGLSTLTLPVLQPLPWAPTSTASCGQLTLNLFAQSCTTPSFIATHSEHSHFYSEHHTGTSSGIQL